MGIAPYGSGLRAKIIAPSGMARYLVFMRIVFLGMVCLLSLIWAGAFAPSPTTAQTRLSCEWSHSISLTATAGAGGHDGEIKVELGAGDFPAGYTMSANGDDLRVFASDNTTPVAFFISRWDAAAQQVTIYIRPPAIAGGASATYNLFLGNGLISSGSSATGVFPDNGIRVLSRVSSANPTNAASGYAALAAGSSTVADVVRANVFRINNRTFGGSSGDFGLCISTMINVPPSQAGTWRFRAGVDFGRGGHFLLNETALESNWNADLWWSNNFNNPDVLQGNRSLSSGWHRLEVLGFEGCCDGPIQIQARAPGGAFQDLSTTNFTLREANCTNIALTLTTTSEACPIGLDVSKQSVSFDDGAGGDMAIPGAVVTYEIAVANTGQRVDNATIELLDELPADARLVVTGGDAFQLVEGTVPSGVALNWGGFSDPSDGVEFSTDGTNFGYVPSPDTDGTDGAITHVRIIPDGSLNPADNSAQPNFTVRLKLIID